MKIRFILSAFLAAEAAVASSWFTKAGKCFCISVQLINLSIDPLCSRRSSLDNCRVVLVSCSVCRIPINSAC